MWGRKKTLIGQIYVVYFGVMENYIKNQRPFIPLKNEKTNIGDFEN